MGWGGGGDCRFFRQRVVSVLHTSGQTSLNCLSKQHVIIIYDVVRSGSVVEGLNRDRGAASSSLTGVTALCP